MQILWKLRLINGSYKQIRVINENFPENSENIIEKFGYGNCNANYQ